jgi:hypothetical protein
VGTDAGITILLNQKEWNGGGQHMRMIKVLIRYASWRNTLGLFVIQFALQAMILFWLYPLIGGQGKPLDIRFGLSAVEINEYLTSIGSSVRKIYTLNECTLDMLFPLFYSFAYAFLLLRLILGIVSETSRWCLVSLLPFLIAIADLFENISILGTLAAYPIRSAPWANLVVFFNMIKHSMTLLVLVALFAVIVSRLFVLFSSRHNKT